MSLLLGVSLLLHVGHCQVRVPEMVYAWLESQVKLECRADTNEEIKQVTWEMHSGGGSVTVLTYRNDTGAKYHKTYGNRVRFRGNGYKDGSFEILNVTLADEGIFKCVFTTFPSGTIEGRIQLQVFVLPTVMQDLTPEIITPCFNKVAECLVSPAKPDAEIQWITNGINYTSNEDSILHSNGTMSKRSQLNMMTTPAVFGHQVFCFVYQPKIPFEFQENISININLINIQFPPQMVQIEVLTNDREVPQLLCKSEGNPRPEFIWKRRDKQGSEDLLPVTSDSLNLTDALGNGLFICEATNALGINRGFIYISTPKGSDRNRSGLFISAIFILGLLLLLSFYSQLLNVCKMPFCKEDHSVDKHGETHARASSIDWTTATQAIDEESEKGRSIQVPTKEDSDEESERIEAAV